MVSWSSNQESIREYDVEEFKNFEKKYILFEHFFIQVG
jgi:hypothetical protein